MSSSSLFASLFGWAWWFWIPHVAIHIMLRHFTNGHALSLHFLVVLWLLFFGVRLIKTNPRINPKRLYWSVFLVCFSLRTIGGYGGYHGYPAPSLGMCHLIHQKRSEIQKVDWRFFCVFIVDSLLFIVFLLLYVAFAYHHGIGYNQAIAPLGYAAPAPVISAPSYAAPSYAAQSYAAPSYGKSYSIYQILKQIFSVVGWLALSQWCSLLVLCAQLLAS